MKLKFFCLVSFILSLKCEFLMGAKLNSYGADRSRVSVSGFSSGASMATQFHVSYSKDVMGAGIIAGVPYFCAHYYDITGIIKCWIFAWQNSQEETNKLIATYEKSNLIDPSRYMAGERVFIFHGKSDILINAENGPDIEKFYKHYNCNVLTQFDIDAQHAMPTDDYGNPCWAFFPPFISNCKYDTAYVTLNYIYGNIKKPKKKVQIKENLIQFDQAEFYENLPSPTSMDTIGYIYVPTHCKTNKGCPLHIAFHGCAMGRQISGEAFVRNGGYNDVAELNNIIILYPQVGISFFRPFNPLGCYDWYGFTGPYYATKSGVQLITVHNMMKKILT